MTNARIREQYLRNLLRLAKLVDADAQRRMDPGTSDLDNEQPFTITLPLGVWRDFHMAIRDLENTNG